MSERPRVLFVCGKARMRSPTAADLANETGAFEADFAGLSTDADEILTSEQIAWADIVAVMERRQIQRLKTRHGTALGSKRVICLNIPDRYAYMERDLVERLRPEIDRLAAQWAGGPKHQQFD